ncbi:uncharacterized protein [Clytia hemisphaerica]|uniref:Cnidarian restricted protein n=1 Tax=Clytia hemisphaerica TaxID=252671 RepID=A0A7M5VCN2_9CNID
MEFTKMVGLVALVFLIGVTSSSEIVEEFVPSDEHVEQVQDVLAKTGCPGVRLERVGCFNELTSDDGIHRTMKEQILNGRDKGSAVYEGPFLSWQNYHDWLINFACRCGQKVAARGGSIFSLQFFGECWTDFPKGKGKVEYAKHGLSNGCYASNFDKYTGSPVQTKWYTGDQKTNFVYRAIPIVKSTTPPPTEAVPTPANAQTKPAPTAKTLPPPPPTAETPPPTPPTAKTPPPPTPPTAKTLPPPTLPTEPKTVKPPTKPATCKPAHVLKMFHAYTKKTLQKTWFMRFQIMPTGIVSRKYASIVHVTTNHNIKHYGSRVPGIWFRPNSNSLHICSAVNGNKNFCYNSKPLAQGKYTTVLVRQVKQVKGNKYLYQIYINGRRVMNKINKDPRVFKNVKLYRSDPWYPATKACVKSFIFGNIRNRNPQACQNVKNQILKGRKLRVLPKLLRGYTLKFNIKPYGFITKKYASIFHATTGGNVRVYGDRTPGIWFLPNTTRLHICSAIGGNKNKCFNTAQLDEDKSYNIVVRQVQKWNLKYYFQVFLNGRKIVDKLNTKPKVFKNVQLWNGDKWYRPAQACISKISFRNIKHRAFRRPIKNKAVLRKKTLLRGWTLTMHIKPNGTIPGWSNILHATIGQNGKRYGDRTPGVWFISKTNKLHICSAVNGQSNHCFNSKPLPKNKYNKVIIRQVQKKVPNNFLKYFYEIFINGKRVKSIINNKPKVFKNVTYYISDPWYNPAKAILRSLDLKMHKHKESYAVRKKRVIMRRKKLLRGWTLSMSIKPTGTVSGWSNIFHATIGQNVKRYGDRVPGIWFKSKTNQLHICSAVSGKVNHCFDSKALPKNKFTQLMVRQIQKDNNKYYYQIFINNKRVHSVVNTKPQVFKNVIFYAADPWYNPAKAQLRKVNFVMHKHHNHRGIKKNTLLRTEKNLKRGWTLSFGLKPTGVSNGWANILHATIGKNLGRHGDRVPGVWFRSKTNKLHICSTINSNKNHCYDSGNLPRHKYSRIIIRQVQLKRPNNFLKYFYQIFINGKKVKEVLNKKPKIFKQVKYYGSNPFGQAAKGILRNVKLVQHKHQESYAVRKKRVIMRRKKLLRGWTLSMSIKPTGTVSGWSNIFHATIGQNVRRYGDRVPGIWFKSKTNQLHICSAVSGKVNHCFDSKALPKNKFTQLMVRQIQKDNNKYYYQIFINNKRVHSVVNTKPKVFKNVIFYAADPWYNPAKAQLRKVNFVMHKHHSHRAIKKNTLLRTEKTLKRGWTLSFGLKPTGVSNGWANILHATIGKNLGRHGDRVPGVWFRSKTNKLHICSTINSNKNHCYDSVNLPRHKYSRIIIRQVQLKRPNNFLEYFYQIFINGKKVKEVLNKKPRIFKQVKYYGSNPFGQAAKGILRNVKLVQHKHQESYQLKRNKLISKRKKLLRGWTLSMSIKPTGTVSGWSNIFHATIGQNVRRYGDRVPGIWFRSKTNQLHICSAVSGKVNHCFDSKALPKNKFTQLMVRQIQKDNNKYYYQIFINNKRAHSVVNTKPQVFNNVAFYAADTWYKPAKAQLRKVNFVMHIHRILTGKREIASDEKALEDVTETAEDVTETAEDVAENVKEVTETANDVTETAEDVAENVEDIAENVEDVTETAEDIAENVEDIAENVEEEEEEESKVVEDEVENVESDMEEQDKEEDIVEDVKEDVEENDENVEENDEDVEENDEDVEENDDNVEENDDNVEENDEVVEVPEWSDQEEMKDVVEKMEDSVEMEGEEDHDESSSDNVQN